MSMNTFEQIITENNSLLNQLLFFPSVACFVKVQWTVTSKLKNIRWVYLRWQVGEVNRDYSGFNWRMLGVTCGVTERYFTWPPSISYEIQCHIFSYRTQSQPYTVSLVWMLHVQNVLQANLHCLWGNTRFLQMFQ